MRERGRDNLISMFDYPDDMSTVIYTADAIEALNSVIRKLIKNRRIFPIITFATKMVYPAIQQAAKRKVLPVRDARSVMNRILLEYGDRVSSE